MIKKQLLTILVIVCSGISAHAALDTEAPLIVHEACDEYQTGKSFTILARFYDDSPIFDPKVHYRIITNPNTRGRTTWKKKQFVKNMEQY